MSIVIMMTNQKFNKQDNYLNFKDEIALLKDFVDIEALVDILGFTLSNNTPHELRGACVIHGGDNKTSFRVNKRTKTWSCFSQKCHELYGSDVIGLVRACLKVDFMSAVTYLKEISGFNGTEPEDLIKFKHERSKKNFIEQNDATIQKPDIKFLDEKILKNYVTFGPTLFRKYYKKETIAFFEIGGGYSDSKGLVKDIIPIRDINGELVGCSFRDVREDLKVDDKYKTLVNKDRVLYNLNNAKKYLNDKPLIIVEGFKSVWRLHELGIYNVVCVMGSEITPGQQALIHSNAQNGIVIMFDNDKAGILGAFNGFKHLSRKTKTNILFITEVDENDKGLDPADLTDQQLLAYLNSYL